MLVFVSLKEPIQRRAHKAKKINKYQNIEIIYSFIIIYEYFVIFPLRNRLMKYIKLYLPLINNGIILLCKKAVCYANAKMSYDVMNIKIFSVIFKQENV